MSDLPFSSVYATNTAAGTAIIGTIATVQPGRAQAAARAKSAIVSICNDLRVFTSIVPLSKQRKTMPATISSPAITYMVTDNIGNASNAANGCEAASLSAISRAASQNPLPPYHDT